MLERDLYVGPQRIVTADDRRCPEVRANRQCDLMVGHDSEHVAWFTAAHSARLLPHSWGGSSMFRI